MATGTPLAEVRPAAEAVLPPGAHPVEGLIPDGDEAKKVLEVTFREARRLGHNDIGTEHILLALLETSPDDSFVAHLGLGKAAIEAQLLQALSKHP